MTFNRDWKEHTRSLLPTRCIFDSNNIDNVVGVGNCGSTVSQQYESGQASAPITHQTANPTIELQRATTTTTQPPLTGESCEECTDMFIEHQIQKHHRKYPYNTILKHSSITFCYNHTGSHSNEVCVHCTNDDTASSFRSGYRSRR